MTVLDTCGVIAYIDEEPAAGAVEEILRRGGARLTTVGLSEVLDQRMRKAGESRLDTIERLTDYGLDDPIAVDQDIGTLAGVLRATYHRRWGTALSIVDCVAAAAAIELGVPLATSDAHLLDMAYKENIAVIPLATSLGRRWVEPHD